MQTAIIVNGVFRYFKYAYPTWKFSGDMFLITEKEYYAPRQQTASGTVESEVNRHADKFKEIVYSDAPSYDSQVLKQIYKWKLAYELYKDRGYTTFVFVRPDLFCRMPSLDLSDIEPNTMLNISDIVSDSNGQPFLSDIFFILDSLALKNISEFYDYCKQLVSVSQMKNIHIHLAEYVQLKNINLNWQKLCVGNYVPVRDNMLHMFDNNILSDKYSVNDLFEKAHEWNNSLLG